MTDLGYSQAFLAAAGELGMCTTAWLLVETLAVSGGPALIEQIRDRHGREFPVLDAVCARFLEGGPRPTPDPTAALTALAGIERLVVVGVEADHLDALVARTDAELHLLCASEFEVDWDRVLANYRGRVQRCDLASFQSVAGAKAALLTFLYGVGPRSAHVNPAWLRVVAGDVRTQFRTLVGWDVLRSPMFVYPRWLVATPLADFTAVVA